MHGCERSRIVASCGATHFMALRGWLGVVARESVHDARAARFRHSSTENNNAIRLFAAESRQVSLATADLRHQSGGKRGIRSVLESGVLARCAGPPDTAGLGRGHPSGVRRAPNRPISNLFRIRHGPSEFARDAPFDEPILVSVRFIAAIDFDLRSFCQRERRGCGQFGFRRAREGDPTRVDHPRNLCHRLRGEPHGCDVGSPHCDHALVAIDALGSGEPARRGVRPAHPV